MNFKTTITMALIFVLLLSIYFLVLRGKNTTDSQKKDTISSAYGIENGEVTKIRLEYKDESLEPFTLIRDESGNWKLIEPIDAKANKKKADKLLKDLLDKRIKRRITKIDDFANYGLDEPQIKYTVWTDDKSHKFLIGNKGISYSVYAKEAEEDSVITIEHTVLEYFSKSPADLRDRAIFDFKIEQVTRISLNYPDRSIACERSTKDKEWQIVQPIQTKADYDEVNKFLNRLNELKVDVFEKVDNLEKIQNLFKVCDVEITVLTEDSQTTLQIGDKLPNANRIYAKLKGSSSIFSLNEEAVAELTKTLYDLRNKEVIDFQRRDVKKFVIERSEVTITCKRDLKKDEWSIVEPIKVKADNSSIDDFLFRLDALKAKKFLESEPGDLKKYGLNPPSIKVTLYEQGKISSVALLIGAQKDVMLYAKSDSSDQVYLVENDILKEVGKKASDFRDKMIIKFYSGDAVELELNYDDKSIACKKHGTDWRISKPVNVDADDSKVNDMLYILNKIKAKKFVSEHRSLREPQVSAMVKLNDDTVYTLLIGTDADEDSTYAKVKEIEGAFTINRSIVEKLKLSVDDLRE